MLREVNDLQPVLRYSPRSYVAKDIVDFARSDMAVAEISYEGKTWHNVYHSAKEYVKRHGIEGIGVHVKGGTVYLVKEGK